MKRFSLLMSVLLLSASVLAGCGSPAGGVVSTPVQGVGTPGVNPPAVYPTAPAAAAAGGAAVPTATTGAAVQPSATTAAPAAAPSPTVGSAAQPSAATAAVAQPTATVAAPAAAAQLQSVDISYPYRLSILTKNPVWSTTGKVLGDIDHLVVGRDGQIQYGVLDLDELLGMGERTIVIPWAAYQPSVTQEFFAQEQLVLNVPDAALQGAPVLPIAIDEVNLATTNWDRDILAYWQSQNVTIPVTGAAPSGAPIVFEGGVDDVDVNGRLGEDWGDIEEFLVDPSTGMIQFGLLEIDDTLTAVERNIPVPWRLINWVSNDDAVLNNVNREVLLAAPSFANLLTLNLTGGFDPSWNAYWQGR